ELASATGHRASPSAEQPKVSIQIRPGGGALAGAGDVGSRGAALGAIRSHRVGGIGAPDPGPGAERPERRRWSVLPEVIELAVRAFRVDASPAKHPKVSGRVGPGSRV